MHYEIWRLDKTAYDNLYGRRPFYTGVPKEEWSHTRSYCLRLQRYRDALRQFEEISKVAGNLAIMRVTAGGFERVWPLHPLEALARCAE